MNNTVKNSLKAALVLGCISAVCVLILVLCNAFFPAYVPVLDIATARHINGILPTGKSDQDALDSGAIVMLTETDINADYAAFNKAHKEANVLAVYAVVEGNKGYAVEVSAQGRDGEIIIITAFSKDRAIVGTAVKSQIDSYFSRVPQSVFDSVIGLNAPFEMSGFLDDVTGATITRKAIGNTVNIALTLSQEYGARIVELIETREAE